MKFLMYPVIFFHQKSRSNILIDIIGLSTQDKRVIKAFSNFGIEPNCSYNNKPSFEAKTIFVPHHFYISKLPKALEDDYTYIKEIIVFREDQISALPYGLHWNDSKEIIESKMGIVGAIKKTDYYNRSLAQWELNHNEKKYRFSLDFDADDNKAIYSYYLTAIPEFKKVPEIGKFYFDTTTWCLEEELSVNWCPFFMLPQLEDHKNIFTNENIIFVKHTLQNQSLKQEIENLVYADYLVVSAWSPKREEEQLGIDLAEDSWKLLQPSGFWMYINQTIIIRFEHSLLIDHGIEISGKIGSLVLEHIRVRK